MNTNYKAFSKKRYIKRTKERKNKQNKLSLSNFDVLQYTNEYKIYKYKKLDELNKYKEIYPKHLWCSVRCVSSYIDHRYNEEIYPEHLWCRGISSYINPRYNKNMFYDDNINYIYRNFCEFCSFDLNYNIQDYEYILQSNDVCNIFIQNNIINKFKKVINNCIKYKLNKIISDKLNSINFINKISNKLNNRIIISNPLHKEKSKKLIIFYDKERITEYLLNNIINYKLKTDYDTIFKSISLKNNISIYRENKIKNYVKFQYLLCIISIMRQKCNFQDYGFCNYFISFL